MEETDLEGQRERSWSPLSTSGSRQRGGVRMTWGRPCPRTWQLLPLLSRTRPSPFLFAALRCVVFLCTPQSSVHAHSPASRSLLDSETGALGEEEEFLLERQVLPYLNPVPAGGDTPVLGHLDPSKSPGVPDEPCA